MPQSLKSDIRDSILSAALDLFSTDGFEMTTVAQVAKLAGISTGNIYRYFKDKDSIFYAAVPPNFVEEVKRLFKARVQSAINSLDLANPPSHSDYALASEDLLRFSIENRKRLIIVISRAQGTRYHSFQVDLVHFLEANAIRYATNLNQNFVFSPEKKFCLNLIYKSFVQNLAEILMTHDEGNIRKMTDEYSLYHLSGLRALLREPNLEGVYS